jgi:bifunctional non-homologous end joining protein LigD
MKGRGKGNEWLLIKKRDEFASPGWDIEGHAYSVLSGRTQEEIAQNLPARKSKARAAGATDRVWQSDRLAAKQSKAKAVPARPAKPAAKKKLKPS